VLGGGGVCGVNEAYTQIGAIEMLSSHLALLWIVYSTVQYYVPYIYIQKMEISVDVIYSLF
jgi:hypothetical protein